MVAKTLIGAFLAFVALVLLGAILESVAMHKARHEARKLLKTLENKGGRRG